MPESMKLPTPATEPDRRPAARKPRIPHPHLEPVPKLQAALPETPPQALPDTASWTEAALPPIPGERRARSSGHRRGHASRQTPAERMLRAALRIGLVLNAAALVLPRLVQVDWRYGAADFLLAGAVLLSGYALLAVGRHDRHGRPPS